MRLLSATLLLATTLTASAQSIISTNNFTWNTEVLTVAAGTPITVDAAFRDPTLAVTGTPAVEMALFALTMIGVGSALCRRTRANAPRELSRRQR